MNPRTNFRGLNKGEEILENLSALLLDIKKSRHRFSAFFTSPADIRLN